MWIKACVNRLKPYVPVWAIPWGVLLYRAVMHCACYWHALDDAASIRKTKFKALPSVWLRYRVGGKPDLDAFIEVGRLASEDIRNILEKHGRKLSSFRTVLDFGCGCGRTLLWMQAQAADSQKWFGCDIDAEAVAWCREHLSFAQCVVNEGSPPSPFQNDQFDFIYAISVFTHFSEAYQFAWLRELRNILKPSGLLLATVVGRDIWGRRLPRSLARQVERDGFFFLSCNVMGKVFPDFYRTAYHTEEYVRRRFSEEFEVLDYIPQGLGKFQDVVLLRKREALPNAEA